MKRLAVLVVAGCACSAALAPSSFAGVLPVLSSGSGASLPTTPVTGTVTGVTSTVTSATLQVTEDATSTVTDVTGVPTQPVSEAVDGVTRTVDDTVGSVTTTMNSVSAPVGTVAPGGEPRAPTAGTTSATSESASSSPAATLPNDGPSASVASATPRAHVRGHSVASAQRPTVHAPRPPRTRRADAGRPAPGHSIGLHGPVAPEPSPGEHSTQKPPSAPLHLPNPLSLLGGVSSAASGGTILLLIALGALFALAAPRPGRMVRPGSTPWPLPDLHLPRERPG